MKTPEISKQTKHEIVEQIRKRSEAYAPEWRFDQENPDSGTALAMIWGELYADTLKKYNQLPKKNMVEFFRRAGTSLLPARPAEGHVLLNLVNQEVSGSEVKRGTRLLADVEQGAGGTVTFETVNDVFVTPTVIADMIQVCPETDGIYPVYDRKETAENVPGNFRLFGKAEENRQEHVMYLCHESVFYLEEEGCILLKLHPAKNVTLSREFLRKLTERDCMAFEYSTEDGFEPFQKVEADSCEIRLYKGKNQPISMPTEYEGKYVHWIRIRCMKINESEGLFLSGISLAATCENMYPELVLAGGQEQLSREYLPFGEQMGLYEEVYFASQQVLSQTGAHIMLSFLLNFLKIPSESYGQMREPDWKLIMKRAEFIPDPEYDIGIQEVVWEYFNGNDWRKFPESDRYSRIFSPDQGMLGQKVELHFRCPADLEPILIQSVLCRYLRARIIKMNNLYRWNGFYITPVLSDTGFTYEYREPFPVPWRLITRNNTDTRIYKEGMLRTREETFAPYLPLAEKAATLYMGFDGPIDRGPVRILLVLSGRKERETTPLHFEYFSSGRWSPLNMIDGTAGFCKTGILTLLGNHDFVRSTRWGRQRFWVRIMPIGENILSDGAKEGWPEIKAIYMNATEVMALETKEPETFSIEPNEKNVACRLTGNHVYEAHVWVKEQQGEWREWVEVKNFVVSGPDDCHYTIDKKEGIIRFSDGNHGKIPDSNTEEAIYVEYKCGGGKIGNVPAGGIRRLDGTVGYVNQVYNLNPTAGGTDTEEVEQAITRMSQTFRHRNRAVTASDYEAIAMESSGSIVRAKCYSNCGAKGEAVHGQLVLVLLLEDHDRSHEHFQSVKKRCLSYMMGKVPAGKLEENRVHVIEPEFVEISVKARVETSDVNTVLETRQTILIFLNRFLDPVAGDFDETGWRIGEIPNQIQILNALQSVSGVTQIESMRLTATVRRQGQQVEVDVEDAVNMKFAVVTAGVHEIDIMMGGGRF